MAKPKKQPLKKHKQDIAELGPEDKAVLKQQLPKLEAAIVRPAPRFELDKDGHLAIACPKGGMLALAQVSNSTGCTGNDASTVLLNQVLHLLPPNSPREANALAEWMNGIAPEDPVEGMLAAQMVSAHYMAMKFAQRAIKGDMHPGIDANTKRMTKLMGAFAKHLDTLQKYRNKGQQTIQVQHVQVNEGGQAIVGNVTQAKGGE